ncbi:MAG: cadherin-like beta sandwich domain-containing protein [Verrucomicrobiota bacterium]
MNVLRLRPPIRLVLAALVLFSAPAARANLIGSPPVARPSHAAASGQVYIYSPAQDYAIAGPVDTFSFYDDGPAGGSVTPLIFSRGANGFKLIGVGTARVSTGQGLQSYPFGLVTGDNDGGVDYVFGFTDRNLCSTRPNSREVTTVSRNAGVVDCTANDSGALWYATATQDFDLVIGNRLVYAGGWTAPNMGIAAVASTFSAQVQSNALLTPPTFALERPAGSAVANFSAVAFGSVLNGAQPELTFTLRNLGIGGIRQWVFDFSGANPDDFVIGKQPDQYLSANGTAHDSTTFTLRFVGTGSGSRSATLHFGGQGVLPIMDLFLSATPGATGLTLDFTSPTDVFFTSYGYTPGGSNVAFSLHHAPAVGADLMVVNNTSLEFIHGEFANLTQGQQVDLSYGGSTYHFVADYFGGTGNDLVLRWQKRRVMAWGNNDQRQLGNYDGSLGLLPAEVRLSPLLDNKTVAAVSAESRRSLVLCVDGTLGVWGNLDATAHSLNSAGVLSGRRVVSIASGAEHSLAVCLDGTLAAWGLNGYGEIGDGSTATRFDPVAVDASGALAGKVVVAVAAGKYHSLALCADGTVAAWGNNFDGELGDGTLVNRTVPVAVNAGPGSALAGKSVIAVAAGDNHSAALCSDGTLVAWGFNAYGQVGQPGPRPNPLPVAVNIGSALYYETIRKLSAAGDHCVALCADGLLAGWGGEAVGSSSTPSQVPVAVDRSGVLAGKTPIALATGQYHSLALCSDGTLAAWGSNAYGELGNNNIYSGSSLVPVAVSRSTMAANDRIVGIGSGQGAQHSLAIVAASSAPIVTTLAPAAIGVNGATLAGTVNANAYAADVVFEYGLSTGYGSTTTAAPATVSGTSATGVSAAITGLTTGALYHYRVKSTNSGGVSYGADRSFTTVSSNATLANLTPSLGALSPAFSPSTYSYTVAVPFATFTGFLTPVVALASSTVTVNGSAVVSGTISPSVSLNLGSNIFTTVVTAQNGATQTYTVNLIRALETPTMAVGGPSSTAVLSTTATLGGNVYNQGGAPITAYGVVLAATADNANPQLGGVGVVNLARSGSVIGPFTVNASGLPPSTTLSFAAYATNSGGTSYSPLGTFTTLSNITSLAGLSLSNGSLSPALAGGTTSYSANVASQILYLTPNASQPQATVRVNGSVVAAGGTSGGISLSSGTSVITILVTAQDGVTTQTYTLTATRVPLSGGFATAASVPETAASFTATGTTVNSSLGFAPAVGSNLMLVKNTGGNAISGRFSNLAHGQTVVLAYGGATYSFVANYYGGSGNDLVLQWANTRAAAWGFGDFGQLGDNSFANSPLPVPVTASGVLAGKTLVAQAAGLNHSLGLCADGSLVGWGWSGYDQLGPIQGGSGTNPAALQMTGALTGKTAIAVATGESHSLVLCSDGTVAAFGRNTYGELGNGTTSQSGGSPVAVSTSGVLAGKTVVAIAAGQFHSLALCSDGTLAAWGRNAGGQLGNTSNTDSPLPVTVSSAGILSGKTVTAIAAGGAHSLALCADGTLAGWGANTYGAVGDNSTTPRNAPVAVAVSQGNGLWGKVVVAIAAGESHSLALCSDGTLAAWGWSGYGQLGNNSSSNSAVSSPVAVNTTSGVSALFGKTVTAIAAGRYHNLALCGDGSLVAWGRNDGGQLGNNSSSNTPVPVAVNAGLLATGERYLLPNSSASANHSLAIIATPPVSLVTTLPATAITSTTAALQGTVNANGTATATSFDYGTTTGYGSTLAAAPVSASGLGDTAVSAGVTGLPPGTLYHYRTTGSSAAGTVHGADLTFTTLSNVATLANLTLSSGSLTPSFATGTASYAASVPNAITSITLTPTLSQAQGAVTVNGSAVASGSASGAIALSLGSNIITLVVTAQDGVTTQSYSVAVTRQPLQATYNSASDVPATVASYTATGNAVSFSLNYAPVAGSSLMVVKNTGSQFISGRFNGLAQGQTVMLSYAGVSYAFIANYYGGNGNDLVLQWANTRLLAWGTNTASSLPVAVDASGVLAGKTVLATAAGSNHTLALCSDGSLAGWGTNSFGQLGNNSSTASSVPVAVNTSGVLAGKTVIAVAAGNAYSLALCSDGTVAAWGLNTAGQLGNNSTTRSLVPVALNTAGVLNGKTVVAIAAGNSHCLAVCGDGTLAAWGDNGFGQLGNNSTTQSLVPVAVSSSGTLTGKAVVAVSAGSTHSLAVCADGTVAAWGNNNAGQLGNGTNTNSLVPVTVSSAGVLSGKAVVAVAAGGAHNLALCADGTLAAWGSNGSGQVGDNAVTSRTLPVLVNTAGILSGKAVVALAAGNSHSLALCGDGTLAAWGWNFGGQLGLAGAPANSYVPAAVATSTLAAGERFATTGSGAMANDSLATVAAPPVPAAVTLAATSITATGAVLNGTVNAVNNSSAVSFDYGTSTGYGSSASAAPTPVTGSSAAAVSATLTGLTPGTLYHYRVVGTSAAGSGAGADLTFATVSNDAALAGLALGNGSLSPAFAAATLSYTTSPVSQTLAITPTPRNAQATVKVNGVSVAAGSAGIVTLAAGANSIPIEVTAQDGSKRSYTVTATRVALTAAYASASDVPDSGSYYTASGTTAGFALNFAPATGTNLMVVNNTGPGFIQGTFSNLSQGQAVALSYGGLTYKFIANYYGGSGNDLVLQWADTKLNVWGNNGTQQAGFSSPPIIASPTDLPATGALTGKHVMAVFAGWQHNLAVCGDGSLAAWGRNLEGQLGNTTTTNSAVAVAVNTAGVLAGKFVISAAAGEGHSLALCSDGSVASWGDNTDGMLGNNSLTRSLVPVAVDRSGVLASKTIVSVYGGGYYSLALCGDGTLATWGNNDSGQLGNNSVTRSLVPVAVNRNGVLAGKTVVAVAVGYNHTLALCSDGTLAAWGANNFGKLGNGSLTNSPVPVAVDQTGVLAGKTVIAVAAGTQHCLALCSDGSVAAWGSNSNGQLGDNTGIDSPVPVLVERSGALASSQVVGITAGGSYSQAWCADGRAAGWGQGYFSQLGDGDTLDQPAPVQVRNPAIATGEAYTCIDSGVAASHSVAIIATPPVGPPTAGILAASAIGVSTATANGIVRANGHSTGVVFEYGPTIAYGSTRAAIPATLVAADAVQVSAALTGLTAGGTVHYRVTATNSSGTVHSADQTFTTISTNANLSSLSVAGVTLSPAFAAATASYTATVVNATSSVTVTPSAAQANATVMVNGVSVATGSASGTIPLIAGINLVTTVVTAQDGVTTKTYTVSITRQPLAATFNAAADVAVSAASYVATGNAVAFSLNFAPPAGTNLMVVKNTGAAFISGRFSNLAQGQAVALAYGGTTYHFVANYYGASGNDLVLQWADNRLVSWGYNALQQLGDGTSNDHASPAAVVVTGVLSGKTILATAAGAFHNLALCSDGSVASWGYNVVGELGTGNTHSQAVPVAVDQSGVLAGKTVVAVAVGENFSLALCSDGMVAGWGYNNHGQLGDGTTTDSAVPVAVNTDDALAGQTVVAIAAGKEHSLALCADGTLVGWGLNASGQLGAGNLTATYPAPVVVSAGALGGKTVVAIAAGTYHSLALAADGTVAAWGNNFYGQLGTGDTTTCLAPTAINQAGVLAGRTVVGIAAGDNHSVAVCADGSLAAWGFNGYGELGNNLTSNNANPGLVISNGVLAGRVPVAVAAGKDHNLARCADGTLVAWGYNNYGQLGNNSQTVSRVPVVVNSSSLAVGEHFASGGSGANANHSLAIIATPPNPISVTAADASPLGGTTATPRGSVQANGISTAVTFDYGTSSSYGTSHSGTPATVTGTSAVSAALSGLSPGTTYHFRVNGVTAAGVVHSLDHTFTTASNDASLASLSLSSGSLSPGFASATTSYTAAVPSSAPVLTVTPVVTQPNATIKVNGYPVVSGSASSNIQLVGGPNTLTIVVTAQDGSTTRSYTVIATGQPAIALEQPVGHALGSTGVAAWGYSYDGALDVPAGMSGVQAIAVGAYDLIALKTDGTVTGWGYNGDGQTTPPVGLAGVQAIAAGARHTVALRADGSVVVWGGNGSGQCDVPAGLSGVKAIAAEWNHTLALKSDGTVVGWGSNSGGESDVPAGLTGVQAIAVGQSHSVALKTDGTVVAWGTNEDGETNVPAGLSGVVAIAAGLYHSLAIKGDGSVVAWGYDGYGECDVPAGLTGVRAVAAGSYFSLALKTDGTVVGWGNNENGQLDTPAGLAGIQTICAGDTVSAALLRSTPALDCGGGSIGSAGTPISVTVRNTGSNTLILGAITKSGPQAGDFTFTSPLSSTLAPGATTRFAVIFTPAALGARSATLHLASNDGSNSPCDLELSGTGFNTAADLSNWAAGFGRSGAAAAPLATPFGDGVPNLLKYAFNMGLAGPNASRLTPGSGNSGLPVFALTGGNGPPAVLRVEFIRRRNSGLIYLPQRSSSLGSFAPMTGTPVVTQIDADWERVVIEEPAGSPVPSACFSRVAVALP